MNDPRISVLLPVFDAAATLEAALASVARQREADFECVIVDDGSRDESAAIAARFAASDARFVVERRSHEGLVAALNAGVRRCRAPIVARMDADDLMHRDRLAAQHAVLEASPDLAAVGCHVRLFPRADLTEGRLAYEHWLNSLSTADLVARDAYVECPVAHPTLAIRRATLERLGGYRDDAWPEDFDLVLRLLAAGERLGVVPRRLLFWRDGPRRLSRNHPRYGLDRFTACRAHFLARGFLAGAAEYVLWGHGGTGKALRRALAAEGRTPRAIVELHPGRLGQRIHGAPVIPPWALPGFRGLPVVVSVAGREARGLIRGALHEMGYVERRDFVCCA
jgi:glycosyltransferase involved in cell wall biosynthesis